MSNIWKHKMKLQEKCNKILQRNWIYMQESQQNASHSCTNVPSDRNWHKQRKYVWSKIFTIASPSCIACSSSSVKKPALCKARAYAWLPCNMRTLMSSMIIIMMMLHRFVQENRPWTLWETKPTSSYTNM